MVCLHPIVGTENTFALCLAALYYAGLLCKWIMSLTRRSAFTGVSVSPQGRVVELDAQQVPHASLSWTVNDELVVEEGVTAAVSRSRFHSWTHRHCHAIPEDKTPTKIHGKCSKKTHFFHNIPTSNLKQNAASGNKLEVFYHSIFSIFHQKCK